jgi:hypothetical protein
MTGADVLAKLTRLGGAVTATMDGHLKVQAPKGVLTSDLLRAIRVHKNEIRDLLTWDDAFADQILTETLRRVAAAWRSEWRQYYNNDRSWLQPEARVEAAAFARDMPAFLAAVEAYEEFALVRFSEWNKLRRDTGAG